MVLDFRQTLSAREAKMANPWHTKNFLLLERVFVCPTSKRVNWEVKKNLLSNVLNVRSQPTPG